MIHMIRRQYVDVEVNGTESDGLALQRRLPVLCQHWLTPAIEQVLERCAPPDGHLYIERVEIDVGTLPLGRLEQELPELVALALEKAIRDQAPVEGGLAPGLRDDSIRHKTDRQSLDEAFLYFLETGSLPWSCRLPADSRLEQALLNSWREGTAAGDSSRAVNEAVVRVLASATVRQRLNQQFSPVFLETLLGRLSPEAKMVIDEMGPILRGASVAPVGSPSFEKQVWEIVFADVAAGRIPAARRLVSAAWRALPISTAASTVLASVLERHWPGITGRAPVETLHSERAEPIWQTDPGWPLPSSSASEETPLDSRADLDPGEAQARREHAETRGTLAGRASSAAQEAEEETAFSTAREAGADTASFETPAAEEIGEHPEARDGIYIQNAGLVLLHPFLPQFFTALDIAAENELLQPERALCLLHFLTTGQSMAPEYELILPKILCQIPLTTPVEANLELTAAETEEAVALLEAVIRHWEVLRNTSPDGLRGTFLLRRGKVSLRDDGDWLLQVESNSVDVLLDQLPWGISMIKLPWMDTLLWVEWV